MEKTRVVLDPAYRIAQVDPRVFGGFLEHMGRAVYEGVHDPQSFPADENGFRQTVPDGYALSIGLLVLQQGSYIQRGSAYAGAFIATMPVLVFYNVFQRRIIAGITMAGMAGQ
jgi:hypothetical protein